MADEPLGEKTEDPTPKKRRESREKGNVAKSTEVNSVLVLFTGTLMLFLLGSFLYHRVNRLFYRAFSRVGDPTISQQEVISIFMSSAGEFFKMILPVAGVIMVVGIFANIIQIGFLITGKPLVPKLEKINPLSGFKRLFAIRSLVEAVKNILKILIVGVIAYITMKSAYGDLIGLYDTSVRAIWETILMTGLHILFKVALVLLIIALIDYFYQRHEHEKKIKMSKQEIKEERKQMEGDPQVKSRIKSLQREMAKRRMMEEVPQATVVVTNPTHLAIAIKYNSEEMSAPLVVAKGKSHMAERIKQTAEDNEIPVVQDKPLARTMYDKVEPGDDIPVEFYNAVAEILAYVYKLKGAA